MAAKIFGDTFRLNEFSNQRFLYGNLIPTLLGVITSVSLFLNILPFTLDYLPFFTLISLLSLLIAFIIQRLSRFIVYRVCRVEKLYEDFLENEYELEKVVTRFFEQQESKNYDQKVSTDKILLLLSRAILDDFKEIYNETYFYPSSTIAMDELRRHETMFLLGFWGSLWSIICLIISIIFFRDNPIEIPFFGSPTTWNIYYLVDISILLIILLGLVVIIHERSAIRSHLLYALPLYVKPIGVRQTAMTDTVKKILIEPQNEQHYFTKELESEIRQYHRLQYIDLLAGIRLENALNLLIASRGTELARTLVESVDEVRRSIVHVSRIKSLRDRIKELEIKRSALISLIGITGALLSIVVGTWFSEFILSTELISEPVEALVAIILTTLVVILGYVLIELYRSLRKRRIVSTYLSQSNSIEEIAEKFNISERSARKILIESDAIEYEDITLGETLEFPENKSSGGIQASISEFEEEEG